jgi:hypothetical protein
LSPDWHSLLFGLPFEKDHYPSKKYVSARFDHRILELTLIVFFFEFGQVQLGYHSISALLDEQTEIFELSLAREVG